MYIEYLSVGLNERQTLYATKSVQAVIRKDGNAAAINAFMDRLQAAEHGLYRVRRIMWAKGRSHRDLVRVATGTRDEMLDRLRAKGMVEVSESGHNRVTMIARTEGYPSPEETWVVIPSDVQTKQIHRTFEENWTKYTAARAVA